MAAGAAQLDFLPVDKHLIFPQVNLAETEHAGGSFQFLPVRRQHSFQPVAVGMFTVPFFRRFYRDFHNFLRFSSGKRHFRTLQCNLRAIRIV